MRVKTYPEHGGNVYYFAKILGVSPFEIIDLSSSVNPLLKKYLKISPEELFQMLEHYPEPEGETLKSLISQKYGLKEEHLLLGNGSMELIKLLLLNLPFYIKILLPEPTFVGYKKILNLRDDIKVIQFFSLNDEEILQNIENFFKKEKGLKGIILCNPNNPTGLLLKKDYLKQLLTYYDNVYFIIDEAFIDFVEEESLLSEVERLPNLFIFRSFTKFYGLAGARVGYFATSNALLKKIKSILPVWNVNTLSLYLAEKLLSDETFKKESLKYFTELKGYFEKELSELKVSFLPSVTNFYLLRGIPRAEGFFFYLLKSKKILVRPAFNFYGLTKEDLRVSLKDFESINLFLEALREWLKGF